MFNATVSGNLGRDAEVRTIQGGRTVTEFPVGVNRKQRGEDQTVWVRCSIWGERGEKLAPYLAKGTKVCASGRMWASLSHGDGDRTYLNVDLDVQEVEFMSRAQQAPQPAQAAYAPQQEQYDPALQAYVDQAVQAAQGQAYDEDIPF